MEETRKQTVDRIAEFFNGESNNAKVDTYKKLLDFEEEVKKQFSLQGVVASLPSKNALTVKAWSEAKKHKESNNKVNIKDYAFGYIDGGEYVKSENK